MKGRYLKVKFRGLEDPPSNKAGVDNCRKRATNPRRVLFLFVMLCLTVLLGGCSKAMKKEKIITRESRAAQLIAARAAQLEWTFQFLGASLEESDAIVSDLENLRDIASAASFDTLKAGEVWLSLTRRIWRLNDRFSDELGVSRAKGGLILINTLGSAEAQLLEECDRPDNDEYMQMPASEFTQALEKEKNDGCSTVSSDDADDTDDVLTPQNASSVGAQIRACVDETLDNLTSVDDCQGGPLADGDQDAGIPPAGVDEETPAEETQAEETQDPADAGVSEETSAEESPDPAEVIEAGKESAKVLGVVGAGVGATGAGLGAAAAVGGGKTLGVIAAATGWVGAAVAVE